MIHLVGALTTKALGWVPTSVPWMGQEAQQRALCVQAVRGSWVEVCLYWVILALLCHILVHRGFFQDQDGGERRGRGLLPTKWCAEDSATKSHPL